MVSRVKDECLLMIREEGQEEVSVCFHRIKPRNTFVQICFAKSSFIMLALIREKKKKKKQTTQWEPNLQCYHVGRNAFLTPSLCPEE